MPLHVKLMEIESVMVVTRGWGWGAWGRNRIWSKGSQFQLGGISFSDLLHRIVTRINNVSYFKFLKIIDFKYPHHKKKLCNDEYVN